MNLPFVTEPYFKCSISYFISYFSCIIIFVGLVILSLIAIPDDTDNVNVVRFSFISSSIFFSLILARILCVCLIPQKDDEIEILRVNDETKNVEWYNE